MHHDLSPLEADAPIAAALAALAATLARVGRVRSERVGQDRGGDPEQDRAPRRDRSGSTARQGVESVGIHRRPPLSLVGGD
jgi:hypothetical protein